LEPNPWVVAATAASVSLQLACVLIPPLREVMGLRPLASLDLLVVGALLLATLVLGELLLRVLRSAPEPPRYALSGSD
jgi:hypothetical protein